MPESNNGFGGFFRQLRINLRARARLRRQQARRARTLRLKYITSEQLGYADVLDAGVTIGRSVLAGTFILYAFGLATPKVAFSDLPAYWSMPADAYLRAAGVGTGWSWLGLIGHGDYMNFIGIAFLCGLTIVCYLRVLPFSLQRKDFAFGTILVLELIVLTLAASGLLVAHH
jgi:hypothetical protein